MKPSRPSGPCSIWAHIDALERANEYRPSLLHGEGVGAGMAMALRYSVKLGVCPGQDAVYKPVERAGSGNPYPRSGRRAV